MTDNTKDLKEIEENVVTSLIEMAAHADQHFKTNDQGLLLTAVLIIRAKVWKS